MISGGDFDAFLSHICLHRFNLLPLDYLKLTANEKAFIMASVELSEEE